MARGESYISAKTANALVSDLAPTRLSPECLSYVNLILDEVLYNIVDRAGSIDPQDVKLKGVPALFAAESSTTPIVSHFGAITKAHTRSASGQSNKPMLNPLKTAASSHEAGSKSLARDAINEAELELAAWRTAASGVRKDAFQQDRRGLRAGFTELPFPSREAADFLRSRVAAYSVSLAKRMHVMEWFAENKSYDLDHVESGCPYARCTERQTLDTSLEYCRGINGSGHRHSRIALLDSDYRVSLRPFPLLSNRPAN